MNNHSVISSGLRGLACAAFSTTLTAFLSWTFVASTNTMNWMGSDTFASPQITMPMEDTTTRTPPLS